jgi:methionyl-tRNA synthetase
VQKFGIIVVTPKWGSFFGNLNAMKEKFYVTAAIPYVNAKPHVGHALEFVQTDTIARYNRLLGREVLSLSGGDENALKNVQAAEKEGVPIDEFVNTNSELFRKLAIELNAEFGVWQRGSDIEHHHASSQKLWELCKDDIYKQKYSGLYCVGCEVFYGKEELNENGECFEHPGKSLEIVEEENYFFKLTKYGEKIKSLIESDELKIIPEKRKNEVLSFIKSGLTDISISRSNERAKNWGVKVPGDDSQRMYVWFDALNIYQSGVGFGLDEEQYKKWWPADLHVIGKGILRFHAVYWPAFLLSSNLKLPKAIFVHEYFTVGGQKMSKTLGNVIDPVELIKKYGVDALRYYFLAKFSPFNDGDFSEDKFKETYNADLANGIGNLVARVAKMVELSDIVVADPGNLTLSKSVCAHLDEYRFDNALGSIWRRISELDRQIDENELWRDTKSKEELLKNIVGGVRRVAFDLQPFLPETSEKILKQFKGPKIKSGEGLFPRLK